MNTQLEIFCGTGGVGKTTLAASRAYYQSVQQNKKTLLITIDPSNRLKQLLNLEKEGEITQVQIKGDHSMNAMLMSPQSTFERITKFQSKRLQNSRILTALMKPYGGLQEIMSVIELQYQLDSNQYDCIILDTPPGPHFLDFLESSQKINNFFNSSFIETFNAIQKTGRESQVGSLMKKIGSLGINKVLSFLEKVTGKPFIDEFIDTINLLFDAKDQFMRALEFPAGKADYSTSWYLVTSVEQQKIMQAEDLANKASRYLDNNISLLINKTCHKDIHTWEPQNTELKVFKEAMLAKEFRIKEFAAQSFKRLIVFPEVLDTQALVQLEQLSQNWTAQSDKQ